MVQQIVHLWSGNIAETEHALRLLLIVDYICDWARKVYRVSVIEQLLHIAHDPTPSLGAETGYSTLSDTYSWDQRVDNYVLGRDQELEENYLRPSKTEITVAQVLELLDSQDIAIRDARYRHFRVCALQINTDNIEDFFLYERNHEAVQARAKALMKCLKAPDAWRVKIGALKALEKFWVGCHIVTRQGGCAVLSW
ncbi:uncharacterized protein A1O5_00489 [Cladophialophora psammophila CBS 110553]|uniref:Uncharacterized protein n=1 Tax=Cladophialophora psammophila CBS 110553 TaxID=1182543 RepID=W9XGB1_9EURO|nr:uncharacterized protein A1O5_00489 [Cladophialophora psammophila CBS 110553]EXJ75981.1 hypothetical protein A1O5_00489 [Cladophialophora psammophila CBS 110553]